MKKIFIVLISLSSLISNAQENNSSSSKPIVLTHVNVLDVSGSLLQSDMTIIITGNRITALDKSGKIKIPKEALIIDATGKYLIPGLWDMHMHVYGSVLANNESTSAPGGREYRFAMCIATGVTGIREMWTKMDEMPQVNIWRKQFYEHPGTIPRFGAVGTMVDGVPPVWEGCDTASTIEEARLLVQRIKASGVDFVKVYENLSPEVYFAIADEAKKQNIPFAGHVPYQILFKEASDAGHRSIEHLTGMPNTSFDRPTIELMGKTFLADGIAKGSADTVRMKLSINEALELCDSVKASALYTHVAMNGTWQVPTLVTANRYDENILFKDPRLKYIPLHERLRWENKTGAQLKSRTPEQRDADLKHFKLAMAVILPMKKAGIQFLAGTDVNNHYLYAGFSLHDELALLVEAGLTPMEALQTATINPAKFLGTTDSLGSLEIGKIADMVLLEANPLTDIHNTQRINAVFVNGKYLSKKELQEILHKVETDANKK